MFEIIKIIEKALISQGKDAASILENRNIQGLQ